MARESPLQVQVDGVDLPGELTLPDVVGGVVLFAHGSGSSRHSPRNRRVVRELAAAGVGTFLFDLLTPDEDRDYAKRFDIALLSTRLAVATEWFERRPVAAGIPLGYFGASTGAAAALEAAARLGPRIRAVVSRGGRPDLVGAQSLGKVTAPTLLIVGGEDREVLAMNRAALGRLHCQKALRVVAGATHLFEEPGALDEAAALASEWFLRWLALPAAGAASNPHDQSP